MSVLSSDSTAAQKSDDQKTKPDEDKGILFDKQQFPGFIQSEFDRYWGTLSADKTKYLAKLALRDSFDIDIFPPTPELDDPDADLPANDGGVSTTPTKETFRSYDCTTSQWGIMQNLRAELGAAEQAARDQILSSEAGKGVPESEMVKIRKSIMDKDARAYYYMAKIFFRMSKTKFNQADRTQLRDACDAMSHRTIISVPNSQGQSNRSYT